MDRFNQFEITWVSLWRIALFAVMIYAVYWAADVFAAVFLALVISSAISPIVTVLEKIKLPRTIGTIITFLSVIALFGVILYTVVPIMIEEANGLLERFFPLLANFGFDTSKLSDISSLALEKLYQYSAIFGGDGTSFGFFTSFLGNLSLALSVIAISFYLTIDNHGVEKFLRAILPADYEDKVANVYFLARKKISYWAQAQVLLSFFVGFMVFIGLSLFGVKNAFLLGLLAAVFEIIPYVGPFFAGGVAVLAALAQSPALALYVLIFFIVVQRLEGDVLVPTLMKRAIGIHPVVVLVSLLLGAKFFGFMGLVLAIPAAVVLQVFVEDWSSRKVRSHRLI